MARAATKSKPRVGKPQVKFVHKLALNQWLLSLFDVTRFEQLAEHLRNEKLEGLDENNVHHFHHALTAQLFNLTKLPTHLLLEYDQNIVKHTQRLNDRRITRGEAPIVWKYFQYLTLLFTEIYLDRYFSNPAALLTAINEQIATCNADKPEADHVTLFQEDGEAWSQLNKLAYWSATGSGKTLLMHANILQYQFYLQKRGRRRELNRIILLTPNEGLSQQHLQEFEAAGLSAELFRKDGAGLYAGQRIEILDIHKLKDEMGDKTIAIDAFEGNNLVLVDEGHRGASGGEDGAWMRFRNALCEKGFSFEYSATFGQAVKGNRALTDTYAKSILFDYSYRYFYGDGFGKDYQILNLDEGTQANHLDAYLVACLLAFFQQQRLFKEQGFKFRPFNIEKPLWIFVGGSVTKALATREASDIIEILKFLSRYLSNRTASIERIGRVLHQGLVTESGQNLFAGRFTYLNTLGLSAAQLFDETLAILFNAAGGGALHVENLKGATGEIALRVGDNEPFGVINVGEDAKLIKLCEERGIATQDSEFSGSLFHAINTPQSTVNLLIGSKKFTEGWSSWRVSTMGLMNVGQKEGSQIIQLFGRGVRLKGYGSSLKRSGRTQLPDGIERPKHIGVLETLSIFGIRADYMAQFRDFLEEEGLAANDDRIEFMLPIIKNLGTQKLKMIRLKKKINGVSTEFGDAFRRLGPIPTLSKPDPATEEATAYLQKNQVVLNWYPKIQALKSGGVSGGDAVAIPNQTHLNARHIAFLNLDRLYFELERFKAERGWYNLNLTAEGIADLLTDPSWYQLLIPAEELACDSFEKVRLWEEIALSLLKKFTERYYTFRKREWELPHLEFQELTEDDPNFPKGQDEDGDGYYRILLDRSQEEIVTKLTELKSLIEKGDLKPWEFSGMKAIWFGQHLYEPLLYLDQKIAEISPVPLNKGERNLVEDVKSFYDKTPVFFADKELYILRNLSKGRGVGFFEAGNFHPDFILWLIFGGRQFIAFIDPKGIRNIGFNDPKIQFFRTVKDIERRLGESSVSLSSFIVANTPLHVMKLLWGVEKSDMEARNILFQEEDKATYIDALFKRILEQ
ncbi:DEAD/DEAH box helicase family protein [Elstera cyanobacteriorum]|uniref:DEAD/DEAH box helicase family protein n=1 Tax=Elstera cyanobacteriorum TaxID=2022747 RepID=UPI002357278C|nr:DEAD/DEAH box helicase family protein [Elstera cyanobacteriorum]MCK6443324.1 DEAD/DEAH box helicase family protein [Elstera cyanobacteriorum]